MGEGPRIKGRRTSWCARLAWSRFRVVIPTFDKKLPTVVACLDTTLRRVGGVPTNALCALQFGAWEPPEIVTQRKVAPIGGAGYADTQP